MAEKKKSSSKRTGTARRTTTQKRTASNKSTSAKKSAPSKATAKTKQLSSELKGIILIAFGAFLALAFFTDAAGTVGRFIRTLFTGLFGGAAKIFFVYIIWMGVNTFLERARGEKGWKPMVLFSLMVFSSVFITLCMEYTGWFTQSFVKTIQEMFLYGVDGYGGGVVGSGLCRILYRFLGWGTWIVTLAVMIILLVILTETSLEKIMKKIATMIKNRAEAAREGLNREIDMEEQGEQEPLEEEVEEIKVPKKRGRRKKDEEPSIEFEEQIKTPNNDYFDLYFLALK